LTAATRWIPITPGAYARSARGEANAHPLESPPAVMQSPTAYAATVVPSAQAGTVSVYWVVVALRGADAYVEET